MWFYEIKMKISKLILACVLSGIVGNVYAENIYYFYCMHITADTQKAYFSPVKTINQAEDDIDHKELGRQFALSINKAGKTSCYGYESNDADDDAEVIAGREKGINFLKSKGLSINYSNQKNFSDYIESLND